MKNGRIFENLCNLRRCRKFSPKFVQVAQCEREKRQKMEVVEKARTRSTRVNIIYSRKRTHSNLQQNVAQQPFDTAILWGLFDGMVNIIYCKTSVREKEKLPYII